VGKGFDHSGPIGPIHPASTTGHYTKGAISLEVNGAPRQKSDLSLLIWSIAETIEHPVHAVSNCIPAT
jgi:fumarylpyruvate hydrolase